MTYGPIGAALAEPFPSLGSYTGASLTFKSGGHSGCFSSAPIATWLATHYSFDYVGYYVCRSCDLADRFCLYLVQAWRITNFPKRKARMERSWAFLFRELAAFIAMSAASSAITADWIIDAKRTAVWIVSDVTLACAKHPHAHRCAAAAIDSEYGQRPEFEVNLIDTRITDHIHAQLRWHGAVVLVGRKMHKAVIDIVHAHDRREDFAA